MDKVRFLFVPDAKKPFINFEMEMSLEECFDEIRNHCEKLEEYLDTMEIRVYTEDKKPMFYIGGMVPDYIIADDYKDLEPIILEIYNKYFRK